MDLPRQAQLGGTRAAQAPAGRQKEKGRVRSAPPSKPGPTAPPRNVRLRKKYSTNIREVKNIPRQNIPRQQQLFIVLVLIL
jgi:hypothetical protein